MSWRKWRRALAWGVGIYLMIGLVLGYFQATSSVVAFTREWFWQIGFVTVMWLPVGLYMAVFGPI